MNKTEVENYLESQGMYRILGGEYQIGIPRYINNKYYGARWRGLDYVITKDDIQDVERYKRENQRN